MASPVAARSSPSDLPILTLLGPMVVFATRSSVLDCPRSACPDTDDGPAPCYPYPTRPICSPLHNCRSVFLRHDSTPDPPYPCSHCAVLLPLSVGCLPLPPLPRAAGANGSLPPHSLLFGRVLRVPLPCPLSPSLSSLPLTAPFHIEDVYIGASTPPSRVELALSRAPLDIQMPVAFTSSVHAKPWISTLGYPRCRNYPWIIRYG